MVPRNSKKTELPLNPRDWVTSYTAGLWQIYRVLHYKSIDPQNGKIETRSMICSKRFVNRSMKKAFAEESCAPEFVSKLDPTSLREVDRFAKKEPALFEQFKNYCPKPIDCIGNLRISVPDGRSINEIAQQIRDEFLRSDEIQDLLTKLGLWNVNGFKTAQFVSPDFTCRDDYIVYKFNRIL